MTNTEIKVGMKASTEIVVGTRDTAHHVGSDKVKVSGDTSYDYAP